MKKSGKKKNNKNKLLVIVAILVLITFIMLITQIMQLVKNATKIDNRNNSLVLTEEKDNKENEKEELKFDTFVDDVYTENEIESLSTQELNKLLKFNGDKLNGLDCKRIAGSAENVNGAKKIASDIFSSQNQFIIGSELIEESETFYIINVKWRFVSENVNSVYEQKVMVLKKFYFDTEKQILNLDETDKIKLVLDLDNYIRNQNNSYKKLIQSFMYKEGKRCEYILYYINANYSTDGQRDMMNLVKEVVVINPETGEIEQNIDEVVKENIIIE